MSNLWIIIFISLVCCLTGAQWDEYMDIWKRYPNLYDRTHTTTSEKNETYSSLAKLYYPDESFWILLCMYNIRGYRNLEDQKDTILPFPAVFKIPAQSKCIKYMDKDCLSKRKTLDYEGPNEYVANVDYSIVNFRNNMESATAVLQSYPEFSKTIMVNIQNDLPYALVNWTYSCSDSEMEIIHFPLLISPGESNYIQMKPKQSNTLFCQFEARSLGIFGYLKILAHISELSEDNRVKVLWGYDKPIYSPDSPWYNGWITRTINNGLEQIQATFMISGSSVSTVSLLLSFIPYLFEARPWLFNFENKFYVKKMENENAFTSTFLAFDEMGNKLATAFKIRYYGQDEDTQENLYLLMNQNRYVSSGLGGVLEYSSAQRRNWDEFWNIKLCGFDEKQGYAIQIYKIKDKQILYLQPGKKLKLSPPWALDLDCKNKFYIIREK